MNITEAISYLKKPNENIFAILYLNDYLIGMELSYNNIEDTLQFNFIESVNLGKNNPFPKITILDLHDAKIYTSKKKFKCVFKEFQNFLKHDDTYHNICKEFYENGC